ncbi:beta-1,6-N-acetylglucosaminyltransferase [Thetidibacter halocola]|uniref:Peptide O-xylosyltransferase n=1 Tax=Thetidibacter halocola TaxID=2827239 RepID=A0A8J7WHS6_9RHOB|nr:beta-1,6-N-acetylglucosaminyltransferase [Thetidibacter halocola]MBS0125886.1 glycosyl transferase [Thetidibacter halocola]
MSGRQGGGPVGIVMLVHTALHRAEQVARHWARAGCPVVIHVDRIVPRARFDAFRHSLADLDHVTFSQRHRCEWGSWGLVAASQDASDMMLDRFPDVRHVYLASGSCLPLRPVRELQDYLNRHPRTDFIESATTQDVPWTVDGLNHERFTLFFPFSWRRQRRLFDAFVEVQRSLRVRRRMPSGLVPHLGSQWWCLTRQTLSAILQDPNRARHDRFFRQVWIPDEAYFQTLARKYSTQIESRSLTLSKFDYQGKPHVFYDDHMQLLRRSDCFVARKIWPHADRLYDFFLSDDGRAVSRQEPAPGKIDRLFARAVERRTRGRPGLFSQSRWPRAGRTTDASAAKYAVFQGFAELFEDFEGWLSRATGAQVHGHLYAPDRAEFAGRQAVIAGALFDSAALRDANPRAFLTNLLWNTRGERQCFQYGPRDTATACAIIAADPNAQVSVISGAWAVPLFQSNANFADIRAEAARLQGVEARMLKTWRDGRTRARVRIWTMAEFIEAPTEALQLVLEDAGPAKAPRLSEAPRLRDLAGFGQFLQNLKNQGMHPYLMGDFPADPMVPAPKDPERKPYLVRK